VPPRLQIESRCGFPYEACWLCLRDLWHSGRMCGATRARKNIARLALSARSGDAAARSFDSDGRVWGCCSPLRMARANWPNYVAFAVEAPRSLRTSAQRAGVSVGYNGCQHRRFKPHDLREKPRRMTVLVSCGIKKNPALGVMLGTGGKAAIAAIKVKTDPARGLRRQDKIPNVGRSALNALAEPRVGMPNDFGATAFAP